MNQTNRNNNLQVQSLRNHYLGQRPNRIQRWKRKQKQRNRCLGQRPSRIRRLAQLPSETYYACLVLTNSCILKTAYQSPASYKLLLTNCDLLDLHIFRFFLQTLTFFLQTLTCNLQNTAWEKWQTCHDNAFWKDIAQINARCGAALRGLALPAAELSLQSSQNTITQAESTVSKINVQSQRLTPDL